MKKILLAILLLALVAGVLAGIKILQIKSMVAVGRSFSAPPETVSSAVAHQEKWQGTLEAVGSITAVQGVNVTTELPGMVRDISFESGARVHQGDLLVRLDTSAEEAQLRALEAQANLAQIDADRLRKLRTDQMISQSEFDTAEANLKQTHANADALRAAIAKKTIRAPFAGRLGLRLINLGEYIDPGKPIVSLQSLVPIYADFSLPQQDLAAIQPGMVVHISTDTYPGKVFDGKLAVINPDLDPVTRSVRLRATLENAEQLLRPGMFARIELLLTNQQQVLVIPSMAVLSLPYGESVYVIEPSSSTNKTGAKLVVRQQVIRTGRVRGDFVAVEDGLKNGERVVSSGVFKLRNRMPVVENNALAPKLSLTPHPSDG